MQWGNTSSSAGSPDSQDQNYSIWGGKPESQPPQAGTYQQDYAQLIPIPQLRVSNSPRDRNVPLTINVSFSKNSLNASFDENHLSTCFDIGLILGSRTWMISRRYGEFIMLHQQLPETMSKPPLPPLVATPDQSDMCNRLKFYLEQVSSMPGAWNSSLINDFLDDSAGILHLQAEVQSLAEERAALQSEVTEVRSMLANCTHTIQQQGKALMLFERRLSALDGSRGGDRKSWGNYSTKSSNQMSEGRRSLDEESDRSSHASSDFDDLDSNYNNAPETMPSFSFPVPSFSLNCHADELVSLLTPSFPSNRHRHRVVKYIASHIRKSLGATSLCLGSFAERTYLPDQTVAMSCFLCRGQESSWFIRVNEALCKLSGETKQTNGGFKISNVNFVNKADSKLIRCTVNNVAVSMSANQLGGLCFSSFVEEVDALFGNDHLLKRSLLLVKAWWMYESAAEGSRNNLSSYFSEEALTVLVIALFNCQEELPQTPPVTSKDGKSVASTPLEFLLLFFETYAAVDWSRTCVTITGLKDLFTPSPTPTTKTHIPPSLLEKFLHCFKHKSDITSPSSLPRRRQSNTDSLLVGDIEATIDEADVDSVTGLGLLSEAILDECLREEKEFEIREMNVAHPLDPFTNLIPYHPAEGKRLRRVRAAMATAGSKLTYVLQLSSDGKHDEANQALDNIFTHCWARFGGGWRPDCGWHESSDLRNSTNSDSRTTFDAGRRGSERRLSFQSDRASDPSRRPSRRESYRDSFQSSDTIPTSPTDGSRRASFRDSASSDLPSPTVSRRPSRRESYPSDSISDGRRGSIESVGSEDTEDGLIDCTIDCLSLGSEELWKQVEYCRLLLEVEVTEPALRTLAAEILSDKGPLPVGEIGKLLQEITANSNLSTILKDKFGGLKKFLEKYEQDFFVSNDHPFNPHVYLRAEVSEEQIKLLLSGQPVTTPIAAPSRRSKKAARRKNNMLSSGGGGGGGSVGGHKERSPTGEMNSTHKEERHSQSRFTSLFQSKSKKNTHVSHQPQDMSPNNPNAPAFVPQIILTKNIEF